MKIYTATLNVLGNCFLSQNVFKLFEVEFWKTLTLNRHSMRRKFLPQLSEFERLGLVFLPVVKILKTLQKSLPLPDSHFHFVFPLFDVSGEKSWPTSCEAEGIYEKICRIRHNLELSKIWLIRPTLASWTCHSYQYWSKELVWSWGNRFIARTKHEPSKSSLGLIFPLRSENWFR